MGSAAEHRRGVPSGARPRASPSPRAADRSGDGAACAPRCRSRTHPRAHRAPGTPRARDRSPGAGERRELDRPRHRRERSRAAARRGCADALASLTQRSPSQARPNSQRFQGQGRIGSARAPGADDPRRRRERSALADRDRRAGPAESARPRARDRANASSGRRRRGRRARRSRASARVVETAAASPGRQADRCAAIVSLGASPRRVASASETPSGLRRRLGAYELDADDRAAAAPASGRASARPGPSTSNRSRAGGSSRGRRPALPGSFSPPSMRVRSQSFAYLRNT